MKRIVSIIILAALLCSAALFTSCDGRVEGSDKPTVVCSIFPQYDFVKNIVGDRAEVILLQANGADMHSFEPTAKNILDIARADVLVTVGGESDGWVEGVLRSADNQEIVHIEMFSFAELLYEETPESMREHDHAHGHDHGHDHDHGEGGLYDEHIWTSIKNAIKIVRGLGAELGAAIPEYSHEFSQNAEKYIEKLEALDSDIEALGLEGKPFIVADRFPFLYFSEEYGLDFLGAFPGCSSETHASFEIMTYLIDEVERRGADCIFVTEGSSLGIAERIGEETGAKIYVLNSLQSITDNELKQGVGYLELMRKNYEILAEAYG